MFAFFLYLFLIAALMEFDIRKLIDVRQILLVILGMVILYVPNYIEQEHKTIRPEILGGNALWAGVLQTFILLFILLSETESIENLFPKIALMCRPLLYGFCIWQIFEGKTEHHEENGVPKEAKKKTASPPVPKEYTATELAEGLHMLGLSKREGGSVGFGDERNEQCRNCSCSMYFGNYCKKAHFQHFQKTGNHKQRRGIRKNTGFL